MSQDSETELYTNAMRNRDVQKQMFCFQVMHWINTPIPPRKIGLMASVYYCALSVPR